MSTSDQNTAAFGKLIGIKFNQPALLTEALTHRSFVNEYGGKDVVKDNERLEFLGDAVLDIIVADMLFRKYPAVDEGQLTQLRAALVRTESLAKLARDCRLGDYLRMGHGEDASGGRERLTLLCRAYEAVIGALYLDRGLDAVTEFVTPQLMEMLEDVIERSLHIDARSELQERIQGRLNITPNYRVTGSEGPEHEKEFHVDVTISDEIIGSGVGKSKRSAAQKAARVALRYLEKHGLPSTVLADDDG